MNDQSKRILTRINTISQHVHTPHKIYHRLIEILYEEIQCEKIVVLYFDTAKSLLVNADAKDYPKLSVSSELGVCGHTLRSLEARCINNLHPASLNAEIDQQLGITTRNLLIYPLRNTEGRVRGILQCINRPDPFHDEELATFSLVTELLCSLVENLSFNDALQRSSNAHKMSIAEQDDRYKMIALMTNNGVFDWDIITQSVYYSPDYYELTQTIPDAESTDLEPLFSILAKEEKARIRYAFEEHLTKQVPLRTSCKLHTKTGPVWVFLKVQAIWDLDGNAVRVVGSLTDITRIAQNEQQLLEREKNLQHHTNELQMRYEEQDRFIKNAMHEINTPVMIINTYLEVIERHLQSPSFSKYFKRILSATKTLSGIYDDFNYLITGDRALYAKESIDLSLFVKERCEYFEDIASANGIEMVVEIEPHFTILFNTTQLCRIVDNTISNAIKYSDEGGKVQIKLTKDGTIPLFTVKDFGRGIDNVERIFERFYREADHKGGFGIGLTIVKSICDANDITISVDSTPGVGSIFSYRFAPSNSTPAKGLEE